MYTKEAKERVAYIVNKILTKPIFPEGEILYADAEKLEYRERKDLIKELIEILVYNNPFCNIPVVPDKIEYNSFTDNTRGEYWHPRKTITLSIDCINDLCYEPTAEKLFDLINTVGHELCHAYQYAHDDLFKKNPKYFKIINDAYRSAALSLSKSKLTEEQVKSLCEVLERINTTPQAQTIIDIIDGLGSQNNLFYAVSFGSYLELEHEKQARDVGHSFSSQILTEVMDNKQISKWNRNKLDEALYHAECRHNFNFRTTDQEFYNMLNNLFTTLNLDDIMAYENKIDNLIKNSEQYSDEETRVFIQHSKIIEEVYKRYVDNLSPEQLLLSLDFAIAQKHVYLQYVIRNKICELYNCEKLPQKLIDKYAAKYTKFLVTEANPFDFKDYYNVFAYVGKFASTNKKLAVINKISKSHIASDEKRKHLERIYGEAIENNNFDFIKKVIAICKAQKISASSNGSSIPNKIIAPTLNLITIRNCLDIEFRYKLNVLTEDERRTLLAFFDAIQIEIDNILKWREAPADAQKKPSISPRKS